MIERIKSSKELTLLKGCYQIGEKEFIEAASIIANDIKEKYDIKKENIGILGLARGGLPLLTTLSHLLDKREISIMQIKMSNSDNEFDYGNAQYLTGMFEEGIEKFILIEDIIYKGNSVDLATDYLESLGKEVVGIYSLAADIGLHEINRKNTIDIRYVYEIELDKWVYFFWEKGYKYEYSI